jgi:hypothetical protein
MRELLRLKDNRRLRITLILLFIGCLLIAVAAIIGIPDNLPGILLCYAGVASVIYAFIHHWKENKRFVKLLVASIIGFIVFAILHNVLESTGLEIIGAGFFLITIFVCPVTFLIGLVGILTTGGRKKP